MKIALGSDHAGFPRKEEVKVFLMAEGHEVTDFGTDSNESCDYPDFAREVSEAVRDGKAERGILVCGSGIGMSMTANKVKGIRAVQVYDDYTAEMSRRHTDSNVMTIGGRRITREPALRLIRIWLETKFEGGRHQRRLDKMMAVQTDA